MKFVVWMLCASALKTDWFFEAHDVACPQSFSTEIQHILLMDSVTTSAHRMLILRGGSCERKIRKPARHENKNIRQAKKRQDAPEDGMETRESDGQGISIDHTPATVAEHRNSIGPHGPFADAMSRTQGNKVGIGYDQPHGYNFPPYVDPTWPRLPAGALGHDEPTAAEALDMCKVLNVAPDALGNVDARDVLDSAHGRARLVKEYYRQRRVRQRDGSLVRLDVLYPDIFRKLDEVHNLQVRHTAAMARPQYGLRAHAADSRS
jgi:hypothetical protein